MNIHPLFVHFPVALLSIYSILEILRFRVLTRQTYWFYVKATFVILGALSSYLALLTGPLAEKAYSGTLPAGFIDLHAGVATTTAIFFSLVALFYVIGWMRRSGLPLNSNVLAVEKSITERYAGVILAVIGICLISLTGALGGLLAYGPNDPVTGLVYRIVSPFIQ